MHFLGSPTFPMKDPFVTRTHLRRRFGKKKLIFFLHILKTRPPPGSRTIVSNTFLENDRFNFWRKRWVWSNDSPRVGSLDLVYIMSTRAYRNPPCTIHYASCFFLLRRSPSCTWICTLSRSWMNFSPQLACANCWKVCLLKISCSPCVFRHGSRCLCIARIKCSLCASFCATSLALNII